MAGVRGVVNPMPKKGKSPTGIFSTRGSQKQDSAAAFANKYTQNYARSAEGRVAPVKRNNHTVTG